MKQYIFWIIMFVSGSYLSFCTIREINSLRLDIIILQTAINDAGANCAEALEKDSRLTYFNDEDFKTDFVIGDDSTH